MWMDREGCNLEWVMQKELARFSHSLDVALEMVKVKDDGHERQAGSDDVHNDPARRRGDGLGERLRTLF